MGHNYFWEVTAFVDSAKDKNYLAQMQSRFVLRVSANLKGPKTRQAQEMLFKDITLFP